ncbi:hypothetical protein BGZ60DRAFT_526787 [Tricladium varicosporioides]|nr:hypothetical protein BGZ60DRAFT_526787 [Hymenoscyphus varicosporioides]
MRWWARFNKNREKRMRGLLRNRMLTAGFDALSNIPGLFDAGMMVTTLHTVLATRCYEEIQCYLQYTGTAWDGFLKGVERGRQRVDTVTVKDVELRAPAASTLDAEYLRGKILGGAIFSGFNAQERDIIWKNILAFKGIIPSLSKFFQDIHLLQACVDGIRWLVTVPPDQTLFTALCEGYCPRETQLVQTGETTFRSESGGRTYCMRLGYLGLFAFMMRDYRDLPKAPGKKNLKEMPRAKADRAVLQRLASFAYLLGFNTPEIEMLKGGSEPLSITDAPASIPITITTGPGEDIKQRWGLPRTNTLKEDRKYLFLDNLCRENDEVGEGITSFFVLKSWFRAFFGPWPGPTPSPGSPSLPPAHHQQVDEEDVNMGDARPGTPNQRDLEQEWEQVVQEQGPELLDIDTQMQKTWQQKIDEPPLEASGMLQEEGTLFVPAEPTTQRHNDEAEKSIKIRFVERDGNGTDILDPSQVYTEHVRMQKVPRGDPKSQVAQAVQVFLDMGKRTCDRYKRYIPAEDCYRVATSAGNNNTLFLIPDIGYQRGGQFYQAPESGGQAIEGRDGEICQEIAPVDSEGDLEATEALEEYHEGDKTESLEELHREDRPDVVLLENEKNNAANAHILDRNIIIYLKRRVGGDSSDLSKSAKDCIWKDVASIGVPIGDPQDEVGRRLRWIWNQQRLMPHDKSLRTINIEDCYKVGVEADDHTLYLMPIAECPLPQLPPGVFNFQEKPGRRRVHAPPQAQEDTNFRNSEFIPPPGTQPLPSRQEARWDSPSPPPSQQLDLVKSSGEMYRDKIGKGPNKVGGGPNKVGMSFQEEPRRVRKRQDGMRIMQPMKDQPKAQYRKLAKPRDRNARTPGHEIIEGDPEDEIS